MARPRSTPLRLATLLTTSFLVAASAEAQCRPPTQSREAKLLAFYEAPLVFSILAAPERLAPGAIRVGAEAGNIPTPQPALQRPEFCYQSHEEHTRLTPAFGRPRVTIGFPGGFALEASYLPPVTVGGARAELKSAAATQTLPLSVRGRLATLALRAHGTLGRVQGAITCPASALQSADAAAPCYGTRPSRDSFNPGMFGGEAILGAGMPGGRVALYMGGGVTWLRPRFQVGFTDAAGNVDTTSVEVDLVRGSIFGGITVRPTSAISISGQIYAVPADVTTLRVGAQYRVR
jgi:hypothetical protein